jgi:hypothetical protein
MSIDVSPFFPNYVPSINRLACVEHRLCGKAGI